MFSNQNGMVRILILLTLIIVSNSCHRKLYCDLTAPNPKFDNDSIEIQKLKVVKNKLIFEIENKSLSYLYIPAPIRLDFALDDGMWLINNDAFSTSVGLSIDIIEIYPEQKEKISIEISEENKVISDSMTFYLLFAAVRNAVRIDNDISNYGFLEQFDNDILEVFWHLEDCNKK